MKRTPLNAPLAEAGRQWHSAGRFHQIPDFVRRFSGATADIIAEVQSSSENVVMDA